MENISKDTVRDNLRILRAKYGFSQQEVADKLGIALQTYNKYERDPAKMGIGTLLKLAQIYDCLPRTFFMDF